MPTNRLLTKQLLFKIVELYVHEDRESLWHLLLTQCLKRAWSMILQPILHTSLHATELMMGVNGLQLFELWSSFGWIVLGIAFQ